MDPLHKLVRHLRPRARGPEQPAPTAEEGTGAPAEGEGHTPAPSAQPQERPDVFPVDAWTAPQYPAWFERHRCTEDELARQREEAPRLAGQPLFSLIVPLYKTPELFLRQMVESVLAQTYGNFELILVNASPELAELSAAVARYQETDERVRVVTLASNLGITENTNAGIDQARGDFCCFLDHDDVIEPNLLFEYAKVVSEDPLCDYLYCDEDMVSWDEGAGTFRHMNPLFKPKYSPELLLCKNYVIHMMTIRRSIIEAMPRPDARFDGSQDYNMTLFATQVARHVCNVPKVLYHWRVSENSTATNPESKPYTIRSCRLAIERQLERRGLRASIVGTDIYDLYNPWFERPSESVSVVVDCRADAYYTVLFLEYLRQGGSYPGLEVVLVNPAGDWGLEVATGVHARAVRCEGENLYERLNAGVAHATGDLLLFMDAASGFVTPEAIAQLAALCSEEGIGCTGPKVLYRGSFNKSFGAAITPAGILPLYRGYEDNFPGYECNMRCFQNVDGFGWQGLMTQRSLFGEVGGFDTRFSSEVGAVEYCVRVREAGCRMVAMSTVKLKVDEPLPSRRYGSLPGAPDYSDADVAAFDAKWPGLREQGSHFYNPNLDQATGYQQVPE